MKCPSCGTNHRKRQGRTCSCRYRFVFDDPARDKMSDVRFLSIVENATRANDQYVTLRQLYGQYCQTIPEQLGKIGLVIAIIAAAAGLFNLLDDAGGAAVFCFIVTAIALLFAFAPKFNKPMSFREFNTLAGRWRQRGDEEKLSHVLFEPSLHEPPPAWPEADIYDYGFERVLILERDLLVDLFVKNNFHADERAIVISETGYPEYVRSHVHRALENRADLPVYLLHDSTPRGRDMRKRIQALEWLPLKDHPLIDLGLSAKDAKKIKRLRATRPKRSNYEVSVDLLPYTMLAVGMGGALASQSTLAELMSPRDGSRGESSWESDFG